MASDLVSRFTATLDELERVAREATDGPWIFDGDAVDVEPTTRGSEYIARYVGDTWSDVTSMLPADGAHIALWDPQAVLQLVAAAREVIAEYLRVRKLWSDALDRGDDSQDETVAHRYWSMRTLAAGFGVTEED